MHLSLFSDYSLRVLMFAALRADYFQLEEVTTAYGISRNHLAKVVHGLGKLGYLETRRGRGGGIRLGKPAREIRLGTLVRETEKQPLYFVECFNPTGSRCVIDGSCRLKGILAEAIHGFYATLNQHTLHDLVTGPHHQRMQKTLLNH